MKSAYFFAPDLMGGSDWAGYQAKICILRVFRPCPIPIHCLEKAFWLSSWRRQKHANKNNLGVIALSAGLIGMRVSSEKSHGTVRLTTGCNGKSQDTPGYPPGTPRGLQMTKYHPSKTWPSRFQTGPESPPTTPKRPATTPHTSTGVSPGGSLWMSPPGAPWGVPWGSPGGVPGGFLGGSPGVSPSGGGV